MTRQLVFVHGRSQQDKDADVLKSEWVDAFTDGLDRAGLALPIAEEDIKFPYFGDTLADMTSGLAAGQAAEVVIRGVEDDAQLRQFIGLYLTEICAAEGISEEKLSEVIDGDVIDRGPQNWEWVHGVMRFLDRRVKGASSTSIYLATYDVFCYLTDDAIYNTLQSGVAKSISNEVETVVVAHSLGTVVAYDVLRKLGAGAGWRVPLFVTVGCPLGVSQIRERVKLLAGPLRCPPCAKGWFNAMDKRDVVALYPLTPTEFPMNPPDPAIENKTDVRNQTDNRHGISGYLNDPEVASRIHAALSAP